MAVVLDSSFVFGAEGAGCVDHPQLILPQPILHQLNHHEVSSERRLLLFADHSIHFQADVELEDDVIAGVLFRERGAAHIDSRIGIQVRVGLEQFFAVALNGEIENVVIVVALLHLPSGLKVNLSFQNNSCQVDILAAQVFDVQCGSGEGPADKPGVGICVVVETVTASCAAVMTEVTCKSWPDRHREVQGFNQISFTTWLHAEDRGMELHCRILERMLENCALRLRQFHLPTE